MSTKAKKVRKPKERKEIFLVLKEDNEFVDFFDTLVLAENYIDKEEMDQALILRVVQAWQAWFPEEPEIEFGEINVGNLVEA